ncbi:hypothetical protein [Oceanobacillus oncorhynchi]|uniref:hypothetical protein n=1 Tax=Oceanobacillus oncorhynchi TaxID=545501 RepID=UPI0034D45F89
MLEKGENPKVINNLGDLMYWNPNYLIKDSIVNAIIAIKKATDNELAKNGKLSGILKEAEEQEKLIEVLLCLAQEYVGMMLSRSALEQEPNAVLKKMVVMLLTFKVNSELKMLYQALLGNKELFYKYMM